MRTPLRLCLLLLPPALTLLLTHPVCAQSSTSKKSVQLTFLPPPLENASYSLGIYEAKNGKLVRRLHEAATENAFTAGLNGLITKWDGKDDDGKPVPPGHYAARGYGVGPLKVEGIDTVGNDWTDDDETLRITHVLAIALVPVDSGLAVLASLADGSPALMRFSGEGKLLWRKPVGGLPKDAEPWLTTTDTSIAVMPKLPASDGVMVSSVANHRVDDGEASSRSSGVSVKKMTFPLPPNSTLQLMPSPEQFAPTISKPDLSLGTTAGAAKPGRDEVYLPSGNRSRLQRSPGKDGTVWVAAELMGLLQTAPDRSVLRRLEPVPDDPLPCAVSASTSQDRLYLLEEKNGWQRVRGLSWMETKEENGKPVSTWQTFFERNIHAPGPVVNPEHSASAVEISLVENPLDPGKPQKIKLSARVDEKGSYLTTADGLRLRRIGQRANLKGASVARGSEVNSLTLSESDGAAQDEFSIKGANEMMSFDAGEFEMTANGEKPIDTKAAEPPDL